MTALEKIREQNAHSKVSELYDIYDFVSCGLLHDCYKEETQQFIEEIKKLRAELSSEDMGIELDEASASMLSNLERIANETT